jgi:hypothetical protein
MIQFDTTLWNPKHAGGYTLGDSFKVLMKERPMWIHRKMMGWCFGWQWIDN